MSKKPLFIGAVASIIAINSVFADTTVTSKQYVDTTRQATIPVAGTNANTPGSTVVTYTGTAGQIGERGIFDPETDWDNENGEVVSGHDSDLVTAGFIVPAVNQLYQQMDELPQILSGPANTVAMYNDEGVLGDSRGIYDGSNEYNSSTDADKLVTASALQDIKGSIPNVPVTVTKKSCEEYIENTEHTDSNCLLWRFTNVDVLADCSDRKCESR